MDRLHCNDTRVIPSFIRGIIENSKIIINGDGSQTRSFCYISDTIRGLISLMESNCGYPINIGNDKEISINELANKIVSKFNQLWKLRKKFVF